MSIVITLIDSPLANIANIARALGAAGGTVRTTSDPDEIAEARRIVLPGVGSFGAAMRWLAQTRVDAALRNALAGEATLLGICVGHQVLFESSTEMGTTPGLGVLAGRVESLEGTLPAPQIGWNRVSGSGPMFTGIPSPTPFYFVNSYAVRRAAGEIGDAQYNGAFTAAAQQGRIFGVQFHPEKSSSAGLRLLRNFIACR